ncbi:SGNH/GDSL hydrolase family protein [Maribacter sp. SA7]|uniref:SGNH/GDSL hydrolase family protein n=1 Tax=Maribacter zhoushanensis TaxID=3030012 RepID=UPI0023EAE0B1|nr:SGNH/GDSL hydrolase family protein [Maribacter zhoushanensis]MDF4203971.1 SGNH/GDSL hydrolase family protein [Maribacter zhoushanensis]
MKYSHLLYRLTLITFLFSFLPSCSQTQEKEPEQVIDDTNNQEIINYLALGDSYTVGESVAFEDSFPAQLSSRIEENQNRLVNTTVIAQTGWRTDQLIASIGNRESADYNLVTLLIGVNNQFQSRPFSQYETEFTELLNKAISLAGNDSNKVIVLSIPDYYYTPYGQNNGDKQISTELDRYNNFAKSTAKTKGVTFLDITDITRRGLDETELVANDGLHPSGLAYEKFVERLYPLVSTRLKD